jgi:glycosyltransferase involved in cell wall biosynthesis
MQSILIICDSTRIGGIERLALDQGLQLRELGFKCKMLILDSQLNPSTPSFINNERSLINKLNLEFIYLNKGKLRQFIKIFKLIQIIKPNQIISHSLRGTILFRIARIICITRYRKFSITTTIHQLPTLSAPLQRTKRFFYSQFSDELYIFSEAAKQDWDIRRTKNLFIRILSSRKKISVCRNGVYLPRLSNVMGIDSSSRIQIRRIIFIGRLTAWKGLNTFLELARNNLNFCNLQILIVTPENPEVYLDNQDSNLLNRIEISVGKSISQISFKKGDLLLYPANYGELSKFTEGVSINVLEMACIGVPSLITMNGGKTWPELLAFNVIGEVDWNNDKSISNALKNLAITPKESSLNQHRNLIDIKNNLSVLLGKAFEF